MLNTIKKAPLIGPLIGQFTQLPSVRWTIDELKLSWRYKYVFPNEIPLSRSGIRLAVDRNEPRGRSILLNMGNGQKLLKNIWSRAVKELQPDVVLDIGANYGEFLFGERYPSASHIIGVEANARLIPWLEKSWIQHPDRDRITIQHAIAAEKSNVQTSFFVDPTSSGRSAVVCRKEQWVEQQVSTIAIDDMLSDINAKESNVLFKIDVEGHEYPVLQGMEGLISSCANCLGLIEFNSRFVQQSGVKPTAFLEFLAARFEIIPITKAYSGVDASKLMSMVNQHDVELDLALLSSPALCNLLNTSNP